ncbi:MAG: TatD family hydrolase, partial [bacterium]|nr:TatD family hydrolase [bacterium]
MIPRLIDTHAHVHFTSFQSDTDAVVRRALDAGIGMIAVGTQRDTSAGAVATAERYDGVWAAVGLHPLHTWRSYHDPQELGSPHAGNGNGFYSREETVDLEYYRNLARNPKVVAIGEFGLDYYRLPGSLTDRAIEQQEQVKKSEHDAAATEDGHREAVIQGQKAAARAQLELSMEIGKPVLLHCRNAHADLQKLVDEAGFDNARSPKGIIHSFTGTVTEAEEWLRRDFLIAFNGIVTFAPELEPVVRSVPLER